MKAVLLFALLAVSARAGVVAPVENGVAPAGTYVPAAPAVPAAAGGFAAPSFGGALGLSGGLPLLPAPVPGLAGPALHFMGEIQDAAAVQPQAVAVKTRPSSSSSGKTRASDETPALPEKPVPGGAGPALSRDRRSTASAPEGRPTLSGPAGAEAARRPVSDPSALVHSRAEKAVEVGRGFFDRGVEGRDALQDPAYGAAAGGSGLGVSADGGPLPASDGNSPAEPSIVSGGHDGPGSSGLAAGRREGELLRDAVASAASAPGRLVGPAALSYFGSAAPNGDPAAKNGAAFASVPAAPVPAGAPRPLALDLSRSGLVVRFRSSLNGVFGAAAEPSGGAPVVPGPSTALLERGGMFEAFSTAGAYAGAASGPSAQDASSVRRARRGNSSFSALVPDGAEPSPAPLWWAWLILPLFFAAFRVL